MTMDRRCVAQAEDAGKRLDCFIAEQTDLSRSRAAALIQEGLVFIGGEAASKPAGRIAEGEEIVVRVPEPIRPAACAQDIPIEILWQDESIAVVNKPAGMVIHPAAGNEDGTLVNALLYRIGDLSGIGGELRPGIVHRLDKDTSGVLVIAKNNRAHQSLADQFKDRTVEKHYHAIVFGSFKTESGRIDQPIGRDRKNRKKMAVIPDGRPSVTEWKALADFNGATYLDVHLLTGRTHQIRVHMSANGHPVLGDVIYAPNLRFPVEVPRLMLHSFSLEIRHPVSLERMRFEAPEPEAFRILMEKLSGRTR